MRIVSFVFFMFSIALFANQISIDSASNEIRYSLDRKIDSKYKNIVKSIYAENNYVPLWTGLSQKERLSQLLSVLNDPTFNYKSKDFGQKSIKKLFYYIDNNQVPEKYKAKVYARLDVALTNSFVALIDFIVVGDVDWALVKKKIARLKDDEDIKSNWELQGKTFPNISPIIQAINESKIKEYLLDQLPLKTKYLDLIETYKKYNSMDNFEEIPYAYDDLKEGDSSQRILLIKQLLVKLGDYPRNIKLNTYFDPTLKKAVLQYQQRYNIEKTGVIDKVTNYYMNQSRYKHLQSIIINLDKTKIYPSTFEDEYVEVNIPHYEMSYYKNGKRKFNTKLVVGRIDRPTPIFNDAIQYMVINPTWTIPDSLIKRDLIGVLREHPDYLRENNIKVFSGTKEIKITVDDIAEYEDSKRVVPFRFVQNPGDNNALGRVKFMFPNRYAVYLHDTDNKDLFTRRYRVYSSGCMRLENPFTFANYLLEHAGSKYDKKKIKEIIETDKPTTINLKKSVPVHIVYFTVNRKNGLDYFDYDIYMYDQIIWESTSQNYKKKFEAPKKRMIRVEKNAKDETPAP
ncbi:MAG: L,D-transpeptidase family protein [Campylobacterales bacterium]|nr:L,D-transpeptidase family protein [Campylobacterales bacterium]